MTHSFYHIVLITFNTQGQQTIEKNVLFIKYLVFFVFRALSSMDGFLSPLSRFNIY